MKIHSHLGTIINRVKRSARCNRNGDDHAKLYATLPHLFNLAEYLSYDGKDYSPAEEKEAKRLLALANLPEHVDENRGLGYHEICDKLLNDGKITKIPAQRCRRCGRDLSNKESVKRGLGPICWEKQREMEIRATAGLTKEDTIAGIDRISAEPESDDEKYDNDTGDLTDANGTTIERKTVPDLLRPDASVKFIPPSPIMAEDKEIKTRSNLPPEQAKAIEDAKRIAEVLRSNTKPKKKTYLDAFLEGGP
jgi:hypothetical protein